MVKPDLIKASNTQTAKVSLDDCLACSGCVTSAETVLITQQSTGKLREAVESGRCVVTAMPGPLILNNVSDPGPNFFCAKPEMVAVCL